MRFGQFCTIDIKMTPQPPEMKYGQVGFVIRKRGLDGQGSRGPVKWEGPPESLSTTAQTEKARANRPGGPSSRIAELAEIVDLATTSAQRSGHELGRTVTLMTNERVGACKYQLYPT